MENKQNESLGICYFVITQLHVKALHELFIMEREKTGLFNSNSVNRCCGSHVEVMRRSCGGHNSFAAKMLSRLVISICKLIDVLLPHLMGTIDLTLLTNPTLTFAIFIQALCTTVRLSFQDCINFIRNKALVGLTTVIGAFCQVCEARCGLMVCDRNVVINC